MLTEAHQSHVGARYGLTESTIASAKLWSANAVEARRLLGFSAGPGIVIPFPGIQQRDGRPYVQIRLDTPMALSGKETRCLSPKGEPPHLYVPPILTGQFHGARITRYITEGPFKALRAAELGLICFALPGVYGWRYRNGQDKSQPIPDLDRHVWKGIQVFIVWDSDISEKEQVRCAEFTFARELRSRGAKVFGLRLPGGSNGDKVGLDDYLNTHSVEAFCALEPVEIRHPAIVKVQGEGTSEIPPLASPDVDNPFPEAAYMGVAGEFATLYSRYVESPKPFLYFAYLSYLGALLGPSVTLATELRPSPRLYTVLVGETAIGRKSSAMAHADRFFGPLMPDSLAVLYGLGSAEGIARVVKEKGLPVLLYFDELKSFVDKAKQEGSVALPMVNTLFEFTKYQNHTRDRSIELEQVRLSLLAASTRETYESIWSPQFMDIGFLNRLFIVVARRITRRAFPDSIPLLEVERLQAKTREPLEQMWRADPQSVMLHLTKAAMSKWKAWYDALEDSIYANRLDTIGLRLMILLTVTAGKVQVDEVIVTAAVALLEYELAVRKLLDPIDAENAIARMEERIRRALKHGRMDKRTLARRVHAHRAGVWVFNTAIKNLLSEGELASKGGREFWLKG